MKFLRTRRTFILILCLIAGAALLIFSVTGAVMSRGRNTRTGSGQNLSEVFSPRAIPIDEFFLPDEPDFLPETLLERERRESWTVEDAQPFWRDPLDEGTFDYLELMSTVIDELMERTP